jgi:hypothetical protein
VSEGGENKVTSLLRMNPFISIVTNPAPERRRRIELKWDWEEIGHRSNFNQGESRWQVMR